MRKLLIPIFLLAAVSLAVLLAGPMRQDNTSVAHAAGQGRISIDANPWNGSGPCDPNNIDSSAVVAVGTKFQVAVCSVDPSGAIVGATFAMYYNRDPYSTPPGQPLATNINTVPECLPVSGGIACPYGVGGVDNDTGPGYDDNPDANISASLTSWPNAAGQTLDVPAPAPANKKAWVCNVGGGSYPIGNEGTPNNSAYMGCFTTGDGSMDSTGTLGIVTMTADSAGTDLLFLEPSSRTDVAASTGDIQTCKPGDANQVPCDSAVIMKVVPADLQLTKTLVGKAIAGGTATYDLTVTNAGPANAVNVHVFDDMQNLKTIVPYDAAHPTTTSDNCWGSGPLVAPAVTALSAAIGAGTLTFAVVDASNLTNNEVISIDAELMKLTAAPSGNSITVSRGYGGSTAAAHAAGAIVLPKEPDGTNLFMCAIGGMNANTSTTIRIVVNEPLALVGKPELDFAIVAAADPIHPPPGGGFTLDPDMDLFALLYYFNGAPGVTFQDACLMAASQYDPAYLGQPPYNLFGYGQCDNAFLLGRSVEPANVTITKDANGSLFSEGDTIHWTVKVDNDALGSTASGVVITDTADANQTPVAGSATITGGACTETGGVPAITGNTLTCTLAGTIAGYPTGGEVKIEYDAKVIASDGSACKNDASVTYAEPTKSVSKSVTCLPPTVRMEKDVDLSTVTPDNVVNLWLCKDNPNTTQNECPNNGEGSLTVYERVFNAKNDPDGVGAFEFELKYDSSVFNVTITPTDWLWPTGRWQGPVPPGACSFSILNENSIQFGCVSKDAPWIPGIGTGALDDGVAAIITITPKADLMYRITPGQQNGVGRMILDENCELADIYGDPLMLKDAQGNDVALAPGILPGGQVAACTDLAVTVRILEADLNLDCRVDIQDDQAEAYRYGASFGNLLYDPWYDLQPALKDYDIDIKDLQKVFGRNGSTCANPIPPQPPVQPLN